MSPSSILILLLLPFLTTITTATTTTISLSKHPTSHHTTIQSISLATLHRARHLKRRPTTSKLPIYPRSYGGFSLHLSFGSPPQPSFLAFDTASSLVWTPCSTPKTPYTCLHCSFSGVNASSLPTYSPSYSSSSLPVPCHSKHCSSVFGGSQAPNCTRLCPDYYLEYGLGATAGRLFSDTLRLGQPTQPKGVSIPDFLFGCSFISERQPEGIAGFGRGLDSLPLQLGLTRFSHCFGSHFFDDFPFSSSLTLYKGRESHRLSENGTEYTPFVKSPTVFPYNEYYYVSLTSIRIGGKIVHLPLRNLMVSPEGNGGVIVDSGSTFTFMDTAIFNPVARELLNQMRRYKRAKEVESTTGLSPCYDIAGKQKVEIPKMVMEFKGGKKMDLPLTNYFSFAGGGSNLILCMIVLTDPESPASPGVPSGPAVIIGNYQQQNFYVEYDLENERFGFKAQECKMD